MSRKDESYRRDRQKKEEWIGEKHKKINESHSRDRLERTSGFEEI